MKTGFVVVTAISGNGKIKAEDRNGNQNFYCKGINGFKVPEKARILNGTVAKSAGITAGTHYMDFTRGEDQVIDGVKYERWEVTLVEANAGKLIAQEALRSQRVASAMASVSEELEA